MSRPIVVTAGPLAAASANNVALTQTPVSGTALTLNGSLVTGGVATLDNPRQILLTYGNEGSARTLVLTGKNWQGDKISETLAVPSGGSGTVASVLDYKTLTSAVPAGGGYTAAVTLGTNGVAGSPWICFNHWARPNINGQTVVSGTANYTVQVSNDDPNSPTNPVSVSAMTWDSNYAGLNALVGSSEFELTSAPIWIRALLNSGTGSVTMTVNQFGGGN